jgi:NADPH2:quinone reductase
MRAIRLSRFGGPETLELEALPTPVPGDGEVLLDIEAAGLNFVEVTIRRGEYPVAGVPALRLPFIPGSEVSGRVAAVGPGVTRLRPGDRVAALVGYAGGYAEQVVVGADLPVLLPDVLSSAEALPFISQGATAYVALTETGIDLRGRHVLIHGGSSGVGLMLIQLARIFGAAQIVVTSGSPAKAAVLQALGAHAVIDHRDGHWAERVMALTVGRGADVVLDGVGGAVGPASIACMAFGATYVVFGHLGGTVALFDFAQAVRLMAGNNRIAYVGLPQDTMRRTPDRLTGVMETLFAYAADGRVRGVLAQGFALEQAAAAHRALEARDRIGKLYLNPSSR